MKKMIALVSAILLLPFVSFADSTVTATAGSGATVTPSGIVDVPTGITQTFSTGADSGYTLADVSVDGVSQGAVSSVDFVGQILSFDTINVTATADGGGAVPYCSGPFAPGWNVSLPGGGCGSTMTYFPSGSPECPVMDFQGCEVPNK